MAFSFHSLFIFFMRSSCATIVLSILLMTCLFSCVQPLCHSHERRALLQFKDTFVINRSASGETWSYPKTATWGSSECCLWDGVECDNATGHVVALDLSSSCLYGDINSSSSLFQLSQLQFLNLSDNHFNDSQIPSGFSNLSRLVHLDLSYSVFMGLIPSSLGKLTRLAHLDLSSNNFIGQIPSFLQNLTHLTELWLDHNQLTGRIPPCLANLTKLTQLSLSQNNFKGHVSLSFSRLVNLETLHLSQNRLSGTIDLDMFLDLKYLTILLLSDNEFSVLPETTSSNATVSKLEVLGLGSCNLRKFPNFLRYQNKLQVLKLSGNHIAGHIPNWVWNISTKSMWYLDLSGNSLTGFDINSSSSLFQLSQLQFLNLQGNNHLSGHLPEFQPGSPLRILLLSRTSFSGSIPASIGELKYLKVLDVSHCKFSGVLPSSLGKLTRLARLVLSSNNFTGPIDLDMFFDLKYLTILELSDNKFSVLPETTSSNATVSKLEVLGLASCNLRKFPNFLRYQNKLWGLDLRKNLIAGQIPDWVWNISTKSMLNLDLSGNSLTGFDNRSASVTLPWVNLASIDLSGNMLKGPVPVPPSSIKVYDVSNNTLSGEISPLFCNISSPEMLDLSNNQLIGLLPKCLEKLGNSLLVLNTKWNYFQGTIPEMCTNGSKLEVIDLSHNHLQGPLPRSFAKCIALEHLNLGDNQLLDAFPSWLGILPELRLLLLPRNLFHGTIKETISGSEFPNLRVIDLSQNGFTGPLPSKYFKKWSAMKHADSNSSYLAETIYYSLHNYVFFKDHLYSITIMNKGIDVFYGKIQGVFVAVDLSSNKFEGAIPDCIGSLQGLLVFNLSNNILSGGIPLSLGSLTRLESLDLSRNNISGRIPQQLVQLIFLSFFNVSYNHLTGPIPRGNQLNTFENTSYLGNSGLCGDPLTKRCGNSEPPATTNSSFEEQDSRSWFESNWMVVLFGYLGGLVVGVVIEHTVTWKHEWTRMTLWLRYLKRRMV